MNLVFIKVARATLTHGSHTSKVEGLQGHLSSWLTDTLRPNGSTCGAGLNEGLEVFLKGNVKEQ